jgi:hypothetical protein
VRFKGVFVFFKKKNPKFDYSWLLIIIKTSESEAKSKRQVCHAESIPRHCLLKIRALQRSIRFHLKKESKI